MRAIIIEDKDAKALLDRLKLASFDKTMAGHGIAEHEAWNALPKGLRDSIVERMRGRFHHIVYSWLQEQGASVT